MDGACGRTALPEGLLGRLGCGANWLAIGRLNGHLLWMDWHGALDGGLKEADVKHIFPPTRPFGFFWTASGV